MMASVDKLSSVYAVMRLFNKRALAGNDYIRIADETWRTLCNGQAAGKSPRRARKLNFAIQSSHPAVLKYRESSSR